MSMPGWSVQPVPEMTPEQYDKWQNLLEGRTGNHFSWQRRSILQANLAGRMRELGLNDYDAYYQRVTAPDGSLEWTTLVERLTVHETRFFRHQPSFELMTSFLEQRIAEKQQSGLELWSVGCSTGEETWSLAMTVCQLLRQSEQVIRYSVTGTDISLKALAHARQGEYTRRRLGDLPTELQQRFFGDGSGEALKIGSLLRERVCFTRVNVLDLERAPMGNMDVIFCQNLLIYFRPWRRRIILGQLAERLAPGGLLILGPGEITDWTHSDLQQVNNDQVLAFYRQTGATCSK